MDTRALVDQALVAQWAGERAFADVEVTAQHLIADGQHVAVLARFRGLHVAPYRGVAPSGRTLEWNEIHLWQLDQGRLVAHCVCRDDLATMRRLGL